eukprot:TRINITY_DN10244_c0_g1_i2.p1 TRINITY_DN10244_c0_g1~~TRINITY_DN10244_c0_g1_i2.p1  ORF type:complete len:143 (-),score=32.25 TRINITY_DN10244_c0_g1_i2:119-547(-)
MPRGLAQLLTAFADDSHGASDSPWDGVTAEKLVESMHPKMQSLLKTSGIHKDYIKELETALVESKTSHGLDQQRELRQSIEDGIKEMNQEIDKHPDVLDGITSDVTTKLGASPAMMLAAPVLMARKMDRRSRQTDWQEFLTC